MKQTQTLIGIQQEYIETVNAGIARWSHRPKGHYEIGGGHTGRIARGARNKAEKALRQLGYTDQKQIEAAIKDARDMAELERMADA
ncbi:MAG: hypothetical protein MN733_25870 [Nitrososphaera sp.]|nr:hypothetical protein [Nitrososphaera sp.]